MVLALDDEMLDNGIVMMEFMTNVLVILDSGLGVGTL